MTAVVVFRVVFWFGVALVSLCALAVLMSAALDWGNDDEE